jgi:hypothetical protein
MELAITKLTSPLVAEFIGPTSVTPNLAIGYGREPALSVPQPHLLKIQLNVVLPPPQYSKWLLSKRFSPQDFCIQFLTTIFRNKIRYYLLKCTRKKYMVDEANIA